MKPLIDKEAALRILQDQSSLDATGDSPPDFWVQGIERLSSACEESSRTHIAFLGTAILAKATNAKADAFSVKAGSGSPGAYSARSLGHEVLVQHAIRLGIHLGVTGREPLNNQPYFRVQRATLEILSPLIKGNSAKAVRIMTDLLEELDGYDEGQAGHALRAFIHVRRKYTPDFPTAPEASIGAELSCLVNAVISLTEKSECGKLAQAASTGILRACSGSPDNVITSRIHDPDRNLPGDIGILAMEPVCDPEDFGWVFEVRDKPVAEGDAYLFAQKCAEAGTQRASILALASDQESLDFSSPIKWAEEHGITLVVFTGWDAFIQQAIYWSWDLPNAVVTRAYEQIRLALIEMQVNSATVERWDDILKAN